jgi:RNA polymerase sigma-70 factor (ECF subfamily)
MMADLPAERQQAIDLAFYSGLSHSQIAEELGLPLGTVKIRLRLGMEKLRQAWLAPEATEPRRFTPKRVGDQDSRKASRA